MFRLLMGVGVGFLLMLIDLCIYSDLRCWYGFIQNQLQLVLRFTDYLFQLLLHICWILVVDFISIIDSL